MHVRAFSSALRLMFVAIFFVSALACEGANRMDAEVRAKMEDKLAKWNEEGFPIPDKAAIPNTIGNLKSWRFKYAKLFIVYDPQKAHPVDQRAIVETIATEWWKTYPENMKPRFTLEVRGFDAIDDNENESGRTYVNKKGEIETHWYGTDVY